MQIWTQNLYCWRLAENQINFIIRNENILQSLKIDWCVNKAQTVLVIFLCTCTRFKYRSIPLMSRFVVCVWYRIYQIDKVNQGIEFNVLWVKWVLIVSTNSRESSRVSVSSRWWRFEYHINGRMWRPFLLFSVACRQARQTPGDKLLN